MTIKKVLPVLCALALLAGACGGGSNEADGGEDTSEQVAEASTNDQETDEEPAEDQSTTTAADEPSDDATAETQPLDIGGPPLAAGAYTTELMGTPLTLDLDREWVVPVGDPGAMVFVDPETETDTAETILVTRMNSMAGAADADVEPKGPTMSGPSNDLGAWVEALEEVVAVGPEESEISGYSTMSYDVSLDPDGTRSIPGGCGPTPEDRCLFVGGTGSQTVAFFIVRTTEVYRMWMIDQGDEDPILVTAIASEDNVAWLDDRAEAFVAGMTIGEVAPHPVALPEGDVWEAGFSSVVPAGDVFVPALGGLNMTLPYETFVFQDNNCLTVDSDTPAEDAPFHPSVSITLASLLGFGPTMVSVDSVEDVIAIAREGETFEPNGETITVFGVELEGYDMRGIAEGPPAPEESISCSPADGSGSNAHFYPGPNATVYMGPYEGGVLMVTAEAFTEEDLPAAEQLLDQLLPTLALAG